MVWLGYITAITIQLVMPLSERFALICIKIERAGHHIEELHKALGAFWNRNPYDFRWEDDPVRQERAYYLNKVQQIPIGVVAIVGDALHNMRSALDHLAYQLVLAAGNIPERATAFPIAESSVKYASAAYRHKLKGMAQPAINAIDALKPYKGGNDLLWQLNKLNNVDKHRLLITACSVNSYRSMSPTKRAELIELFKACHSPDEPVPDLRNTLSPVQSLEPLKVGLKLCTIPISELEPEIKFHFDVAFDEPQIIERNPITDVLGQMKRTVAKIVLDFDDFLQ